MKNETIEQQKKARKEFLELKKMQSGEITPEARPTEKDAAPKTAVEKIKNHWYHDKWFIIISLVLCVLIIATVFQVVTKPKYDLEIVIFTSSPIHYTNSDLAAEYLSQYCEDIDSNDEVKILAVNCSYNAKSKELEDRKNSITKLQATLASDANALLYITDEEGYEYIQGITEGGVFEDEPLPLDEEFYEYCEKDTLFEMPRELTISCRKIGNMMISNNKHIDKYYEQSKNILNSLK